MRLIDADALLYVISPAVEPGGKLYDPDIPAKDMRSYIHDMPTIDAIPVEWLNQKYAENEPGEDKDYDYFLWDAIAYILTEWQKEQEGSNK